MAAVKSNAGPQAGGLMHVLSQAHNLYPKGAKGTVKGSEVGRDDATSLRATRDLQLASGVLWTACLRVLVQYCTLCRCRYGVACCVIYLFFEPHPFTHSPVHTAGVYSIHMHGQLVSSRSLHMPSTGDCRERGVSFAAEPDSAVEPLGDRSSVSRRSMSVLVRGGRLVGTACTA